jgi:hypothetical protein
MPALANPRWERFAQLIVIGLLNGDRKSYSQGRAYIAAGYEAKDAGKRGGSAEVNASRLLNRAKPILDRVRELQTQATANLQEDAAKLTAELNELRIEAKAEKAYGAAVSAVMGKAKILGIVDKPQTTTVDFTTTTSMADIGRKLLQSVGLASPDDASVQEAVEANDAFIGKLVAIRERAQRLTLEQTDLVRPQR